MGGGPYFAFLKEKRPDVVAKYPNLKATEVAKKVGELWQNLSDAEKQHYREVAGSSGASKSGGKKTKKGKKGSDSD
jgi:hypothetical protein